VEGKLGHASVGNGAALLKRRGARDGYLLLLVILRLPGVNGMRFEDVDNKKRGLPLVLFVELVERGNLPAKRRSSVAPEHQDDRPLPAKRCKFDARRPVAIR
jgi:hypothetical protein